MDKRQPECQPREGQVTRVAQLGYAKGMQGLNSDNAEVADTVPRSILCATLGQLPLSVTPARRRLSEGFGSTGRPSKGPTPDSTCATGPRASKRVL